jgi:hypothetical protein
MRRTLYDGILVLKGSYTPVSFSEAWAKERKISNIEINSKKSLRSWRRGVFSGPPSRGAARRGLFKPTSQFAAEKILRGGFLRASGIFARGAGPCFCAIMKPRGNLAPLARFGLKKSGRLGAGCFLMNFRDFN